MVSPEMHENYITFGEMLHGTSAQKGVKIIPYIPE
jgi:hypothetical protein